MLVTKPAAPGATGPNGLALVTQAEKLEAVLWDQVLSSMDKASFGGSSLGTGSNLYNGLANQALSTSLFGSTDSSLTGQIVSQLAHNAGMSSALKKHQTGVTPSPSTLAVLSALPSHILATADHSAASIVDRAVSYARSVWPAIKASAAALHVPPIAILAQSALETGWGGSMPGNNLFGIKATADEPSITAPTTEDVAGKTVATSARFASFPSLEASIGHYTNLIETRFENVMGSTSVGQFAQQLEQSGYATDQNYASKIIAIAQSPIMQDVMHTLEGAS